MVELVTEQEDRLELVLEHPTPSRIVPAVGISLLAPILVASLCALAHGAAITVVAGLAGAGLSSWGMTRLNRKLTDPCVRTTWFADAKMGLGHVVEFKSRKEHVLSVAAEDFLCLKALNSDAGWMVEARTRSGSSRIVMDGVSREQAQRYASEASAVLSRAEKEPVLVGGRAERLALTRTATRPGNSPLSELREILRGYDNSASPRVDEEPFSESEDEGSVALARGSVHR